MFREWKGLDGYSFLFLSFFPRAIFFVLLLRDPLRDFVNKIRRNRRGKCRMKTFLIHLLSFSKSSQSYQEKEGSFLIQKNRTIGFFFFFFNAITVYMRYKMKIVPANISKINDQFNSPYPVVI